MKAIVIDKKHLTLVSHTNGVTIIEESGCIIDLDFQSLGSIFELADLGNTYTIKDCDEIESFKSNNDELTERIEFLEKQLTNSGDRVIELRNQIIGLTNELNIRRQRISQLNDELNCRDKITKEKTKRLIELENVEYELNKCRETNNALTEKLESKTSDLVERTYWFRYYRRAFHAVKEYLKPNEKYDLDSSGYNIVNSIDSKFIISFKDTSIASKAFNELRYSISPRTVLLKYENDIVEYNVDAMNIYFIEANTPTVIRKFNDENFTITCCDVYTAEITNALLNCGFPASDIVSTYKSYIAFSNIN
ncbi:putative outer capsid protein [uncultured phage cr36_1]|uniref:Outer capsid protein n=1 Tax=uncultured phage cr36_1 TaxID=2986397 RepID=A0AAE7V3W4_9CAUD|nr:putative outer capsid protein [uncultured phage cr36_1]QWM89517.1 putative outer capsid protein [uncultured phage cr36_1]